MIFAVSSCFIEVLGNKDVDKKSLKKVGKTFFQSIGAKKSKIVNKISSELEVLKREGVKLVLVVK